MSFNRTVGKAARPVSVSLFIELGEIKGVRHFFCLTTTLSSRFIVIGEAPQFFNPFFPKRENTQAIDKSLNWQLRLPRQNALVSFFDAAEFERVAVKMTFELLLLLAK